LAAALPPNQMKWLYLYDSVISLVCDYGVCHMKVR